MRGSKLAEAGFESRSLSTVPGHNMEDDGFSKTVLYDIDISVGGGAVTRLTFI